MTGKEYVEKYMGPGVEPAGIGTKDIMIGRDAIPKLPALIREHISPAGYVLLVADERTYAAAGEKAAKVLSAAGFDIKEHVFSTGELVHVDERAVGSVMFEMEENPGMIAGVGSGTINDLCRFCAARIKVPYIIVGTAPSMDGYASTVVPATVGGVKVTCQGIHPEIVLGDIDVLKDAPMDMIASGAGDIFGKIPAALDWKMSHKLTGEPRRADIVALVASSVDKCLDAAPALCGRGEEAIAGLMEALVISGIAMQMYGNSRPASGAEHHIAHFLEMMDGHEVRPGAFHGTNVGIASLIVMRLYEKLFAGDMPEAERSVDEPFFEAQIDRIYGARAGYIRRTYGEAFYAGEDTWRAWMDALSGCWGETKEDVAGFPALRERLADILASMGAPAKPQDLGYTRDQMWDALLYARVIRSKFTILTLLDNWGLLERYASELLNEIYP